MAFTFDSGYLFGTINGQTVRFGSLQGVDVVEKFGLEEIRVSLQAAVQMAAKSLRLSFRAKVANLNGAIANSLFLGSAQSGGSNAVARDVLATVPGTPYSVTPAVPNSGTWAQDLGVQYSSTGTYLVPVASSPAQGQYTVSSGVYTFNAADSGAALTLNFLYSQSSGTKLVLANNWQNLSPYFSVVLNTLYGGQQITWQLNRCASSQLALLLRVNQVTVPMFEFQALGDNSPLAQGTIGTFSYTD